MPQTALTNLGLNYEWDLGADSWKTGMDNNLVLLDWAAQPAITVELKTVSAEPGSPANGAAYVIGASPTGTDWAGQSENDVAVYASSTGWHFATPREGWEIYDQVTDKTWLFDGTDWRSMGQASKPVDATSAPSGSRA